jgi:ElaB/YqjD/DUF883 family membrane-anchored ribosome-binding protein
VNSLQQQTFRRLQKSSRGTNHMQTRVVSSAAHAGTGVPEGEPALPPRVSWGAIFAGGVVAVTVGVMLAILGVAIGASTVDATTGETPGASTFSMAAGGWLLVSNLIGLAVGGYVAARLSGTADKTDSALHGLSVWGIGYLLSVVLLGNIIAGTAATAVQGASSMLGGLAQGAGQAASAVAGPAAEQFNPQQLVERAQSALRAGGDPSAMSSEQRNAEIARLMTRGMTTEGSLPQADRDRLTQLVAEEYEIPREEAERRLQEVETQVSQTAQQAEQQAREAADAAAAGSAVAAYWAFAALLLGAVAAVIGARMGTRPVDYARRY